MATAVILAGGFGTRLSELTETVPKPMVNLDDRPILLHIMDSYARHGVKNFVVLAGYKANVIKEYFYNFSTYSQTVRVNLATGVREQLGESNAERDYRVTVVDTGLETMTGGRLKAALPYLPNDEDFFVTYGDGLSDVDFESQMAFHKAHGKIATVAAVSPPSKFGKLALESAKVVSFTEKPADSNTKISGGFFIFKPEITNYIASLDTVLEKEPLQNLAELGELMAWEHYGFWFCMDTARDLQELRRMVSQGRLPWLGA
jgi:glucose-1-phosphate cytidylyltransferase